MKYIKMFESHNTKYWIITHVEYGRLLTGKRSQWGDDETNYDPVKPEKFSSREVDDIKKLIPNIEINKKSGDHLGLKSFLPELNMKVFMNKMCDEWYLISFHNVKFSKFKGVAYDDESKSNWQINHDSEFKYGDVCLKCDQFDGLIEIIKIGIGQ